MTDYILTKTPHRVSFFGGGTDLESFYTRHEGITLSSAISNYVYVGVKKHTKFYQINNYWYIYDKSRVDWDL